MSDEKTYTEREMAHERQAVARTVLLAHTTMGYEECDAIARQSFPLPKVTRPRVVRREDGCELRLFGTELQFRLCNDEWKCYNGMCVDEINRSALLDLLANPTEEVDA